MPVLEYLEHCGSATILSSRQPENSCNLSWLWKKYATFLYSSYLHSQNAKSYTMKWKIKTDSFFRLFVWVFLIQFSTLSLSFYHRFHSLQLVSFKMFAASCLSMNIQENIACYLKKNKSCNTYPSAPLTSTFGVYICQFPCM